ncbi:hypothetical protein Tco_0549544 [Tanacetum coccineum]
MSASQDEIPPPPPPPPSSSQTPTQQTPHTVSTIKLPILKKGEYDIWAMKMEHYLAHTDYPIWEVIQNGNGPVSITTDTSGQIKVLPPRTIEEIVARERERKARTTLLMALPEDHLAKTFLGFSVSNTEGLHKGYDRFQSLLSQLKIHGAGVSTEDANQKFLRSLPSAWSQVLNMRTKPTNRRRDHGIQETKVGAETGQKEDSKALVTIDGEGVDWTNHSEDEDYALMACNSLDSDTEVISCTNKCKESYANLKKLSDASIEIKAYTQGLKKVEAQLVAHQQGQIWYKQKIKFMKIDLDDKTVVLTYHKKLLAEAQKEKEDLKAKVEKWHNSSKNLSKPAKIPQMSANDRDWACLNHLIRDCDFLEKRMARKAELNNGWNNVQRVNKQNQFVPSAVLTRTGKIPVSTARASSTKNFSTARQSFNRQTVLTSTAMKVNTVKPIVNRVRPTNVFHKTHSPSSRPFKKTTVLRTDFSKQKVNTAKVNAVSTVGGKRETAVKPSAGCNWRPQRYHGGSKYNGGSSLRNCYTFKDPLGRLKPKQAWSVSKQGRKFAKGEPSVQRDPLFDEIPEDTVDHMETENAQDVPMSKIEGTDEQRKGTEEHTEEEPLPKIDPKDKGKKKIKKEDESESESDGIPEAEKKFKQLANDEEMARKMQEELLAEKLQEQEREQFTIEERAKKLQATQLKTKKFEEIQALYEKIKRSDEDFISIGSAEDERLIKKMNEKGIDSSTSEVIKEESKEEVKEENKEEESTRKRTWERKNMKSRKRRYNSKTLLEDDRRKR